MATVVNGGANYNTADSDMKRRLVEQRMKEQNNAGYNQNETARALQSVRDLQSSNQDASAQIKYLTKNLGYKGSIPTSNQVQGVALSSSPQPNTPSSNPVNTNSQYSSELLNSVREMAQNQSQPFSYDPNSDPAYQAALQRARSNIDQGNSAAQAEMNRRGILNSTITSDRMGEIASNEMGRVETDVVPQLMQAAYQRYQNDQAQQQQQFGNLANVAQMYINEDQRGIDNKNTTAGLTGYLPMNEDAQRYVDAILNLKQQAETKGITADQRKQLSTQADSYRSMLAKMGVDSSAYGANVDRSNASQVSPMIRTLQGQQFDQNKVQQQFENKFNTAQFDYQKARDLIADKQYQQQFDEDNRRFGLNFALDKAYKNGQLGLDWAKFNYAKSQDKTGRGGGGSGGSKSTKPNDLSKISDTIRKATTSYDRNTGQYVTNQSAAEQALANYAQQYNLTDSELAVIASNIGLNLGGESNNKGPFQAIGDLLSKALGN